MLTANVVRSYYVHAKSLLYGIAQTIHLILMVIPSWTMPISFAKKHCVILDLNFVAHACNILGCQYILHKIIGIKGRIDQALIQ